MGKITIDDSTGRKLAGVNDLTELYDLQGNRLGYFSPVHPAMLEPQIGEEELLRREQETEMYTYEEVKAHLRSL